MGHSVFDNPSTMKREIWRDGVLIAALLFEHVLVDTWRTAEWIDELVALGFYRPGPWRRGFCWGDPEHIAETNRIYVERASPSIE